MASGSVNLMQIKKMLCARRNYRNFPLESRKLPPRSSTIVRQMQSLTGQPIGPTTPQCRLMGWSGRAPARQGRIWQGASKAKEHATRCP